MFGFGFDVESVQGLPGAAVVALSGKIDALTAPVFSENLGKLKASGVTLVAMDMENLSYLGEAGLSLLVGLAGTNDPPRRALVLARVHPKVKGFFDTLGLASVFQLYGSRAEAVEALRRLATASRADPQALQGPAAPTPPSRETVSKPASPRTLAPPGPLAPTPPQSAPQSPPSPPPAASPSPASDPLAREESFTCPRCSATIAYVIDRVEHLPSIDGTALVVFSGEIGENIDPAFYPELERLKNEGVTRFIWDVEKVKEVDSAPLNYLVGFADHAAHRGGGVVIIPKSAKLRVLLSKLGLESLFKYRDTVEEAVEALREEMVDGAKPPSESSTGTGLTALAASTHAPNASPDGVAAIPRLPSRVPRPGTYQCPRCSAILTYVLERIEYPMPVERSALLVFTGGMDDRAVPELQRQMGRLKEAGVLRFIWDLEGVRFITDTALGYLLNLVDDLAARGGCLVLSRVPPQVKIVLDMLGLDAVVKYGSSPERATQILRRMTVPGTPPRRNA